MSDFDRIVSIAIGRAGPRLDQLVEKYGLSVEAKEDIAIWLDKNVNDAINDGIVIGLNACVNAMGTFARLDLIEFYNKFSNEVHSKYPERQVEGETVTQGDLDVDNMFD